jgi:SAM-dependent methyltransferase
MTGEGRTNAEAWEERYAGTGRVWSGRPNALLVDYLGGVPAGGRALELGCGEGADAIWLARQGWQVLATDIANAGLRKAALHAAEAGVGESIRWERHDLAESFPAGEFALVGSAYLHSMVEIPREAILRRSAQAVAPGGHLYVIGHAGPPAHAQPGHRHAFALPSAAEVVEQLALGDGWTILAADDVDVEMPAPDGSPSSRPDSIVLARREPSRLQRGVLPAPKRLRSWRRERAAARRAAQAAEADFLAEAWRRVRAWADQLERDGTATVAIDVLDPQAPCSIEVIPQAPEATTVWIGFDYPTFHLTIPRAGGETMTATAELFGTYDERLAEIDARLEAIAAGRLRWNYDERMSAVVIEWIGPEGEPFLRTSYFGERQADAGATGTAAPYVSTG